MSDKGIRARTETQAAEIREEGRSVDPDGLTWRCSLTVLDSRAAEEELIHGGSVPGNIKGYIYRNTHKMRPETKNFWAVNTKP